MTKKTTARVLLLLATASVPVMAVETTPPAAPQKFFKSGFNLGLFGGGSFGKSDIETTTVTPNPAPYSGALKGTASQASFVGGLTGGYQHLFANGIVLGGVLDLGLDTGKLERKYDISAPFVLAGKTTFKRSFFVTPKLALGTKVTEQFLFLGEAGPSMAWFKGDHTITVGPDTDHNNFKERKIGFTVGAKVVYAATPKILVSLGADYTHYGKMKHTYMPVFTAPVLPGQTHSGSTTFSAIGVKAGVGYQF